MMLIGARVRYIGPPCIPTTPEFGVVLDSDRRGKYSVRWDNDPNMTYVLPLEHLEDVDEC